MLQGTADVDAVGASALSVESPASEALELPHADLMQVAYEVHADDRNGLLPPALHPVNPPIVTFSFLKAGSSAHGPFTLAEMRLLCRSGLRTRGYLIGSFVDNADMAAVLAGGWGYRVATADVSLARRYDGTVGRVAVDGREVLVVGHMSPVPLSPDDLQYTATMVPARLDRGVRLLQVERDYQFTRAERGTPFVRRLRRAGVGRAPPAAVAPGVGVVGERRCHAQADPLRLQARRLGLRGHRGRYGLTSRSDYRRSERVEQYASHDE